jgi:lysophospholipase L1-like esterase
VTAVWILGAAAAAVLVELAARALLRRSAWYVWAPHRRMLLETDLETLPGLEPRIRFEVNREGERGPPPPRDPGTCRILVAGGSAAECYFLDQDTQWPAQVARLLSRPEALGRLGRARVHVGNIGRSLYGAEALDRVFARILPRYPGLDLAILMVGATDVVQWLKFDTPATVGQVPLRDEVLFEQHPEARCGWRPRRTGAYQLARRLHRRLFHPVELKPRAGKKLGEARRMRQSARVMRERIPDPAPMLDNFERHFRSLLLRLGEAGVPALVVHQPWMTPPFSAEEEALFWGGGIGDPYIEPVTEYFRFELIADLMAAMNARAARVAAGLGVLRLDLLPRLERSTRTYYDFWHFTPAGAARVAELVVEAVLAAWPAPAPAEVPR